MPSVSIIIPTLNEEKMLPDALKNLQALDPEPLEIIVADGVSKDNTTALAEKSDCHLVRVIGRGRALQMNEGAMQAKGDLLVFLHADTRVPKDLVDVVNEALADPKIVLGGFICIMRGEHSVQRFISINNYIKTYVFAMLYNPYRFLFKGFRLLFGDQVMFCRKTDFDHISGFSMDMPIMEDVNMCIRMNKLGRIKQIRRLVYSSDRRVARQGLLKAYFIYLRIAIFWAFGASTKWLRSQYEDIR
jgi:rSAM/selenodomain-associated transferase 2